MSGKYRSIIPSVSFDEEAPDDEQSHHLSIASTNSDNDSSSPPIIIPINKNKTNSKSSLKMTEDHSMDRMGGKKKTTIQDRPWKKVNNEDMDFLNVSSPSVSSPSVSSPSSSVFVSPTIAAMSNAPISSSVISGSGGSKTSFMMDDEFAYDDVSSSSRWKNETSSPQDKKAATVNAVGLAASRLADKLDEENFKREEEEVLRGHGEDSFEDNVNYDDDLATPRKATDHNRVRMEALHLLNLANNSGMRSPAGLGSAGSSGKRSNRVQSALQGLSDGLGLEPRKRYDRFTPDKMQFDPQDHLQEDNIEYDTAINYGDSSSSKNSRNGTSWGSRYSVDRQMMALNGGLSSKQVLNNMEREQYENQNKNVSATNMFKTSPHEYDDRWNVASGSRSVPQNQSKVFYTWIAVARETILNAVTKVSDMASNIGNSNSHVTLGSHRNMDHSSAPKNIFTGMAVTRFLDKLSPRSRIAALRRFSYPDDVNFSSVEDYIYDRRLKRKKLCSMLMIFLVSLSAMIGIIVAMSNRGRGGYAGAIYIDVGETVKFYVTSDVPYNSDDENKLTRDLRNLESKNGDFLVHLGDLGNASVNMCTRSVYEDAAYILKQSPVPVFVLPGDNDWNNCPYPTSALGYWMEEMNRFEDNFDKSSIANFPPVRRQLARNENFSFLHKGVLFMGFHLVDGRVQSEREWSLRIAQDVAWMDQEFNAYDVGEFRSVVIFAHAAPTSKIGDFVWPLKDYLSTMKKPVIYLHANDGDGMLQYSPFPDELPFFQVVRLEKGYKAPPTQITIEAGPRPFKISNM